MLIQKVEISKLHAATYNPRKDLKPGDKEYEKIKKSIEMFGYIDPIIINSDFTIIGGHQRAKVLKQMGEIEVDCVIVDIDKVKEKALNLALNKIAGEWDVPLLKELLQDLSDLEFDLDLTGFDMEEIEKLININEALEDNFDANAALEEIDIPYVKRGDIWYLGKHHLMCGDATKIEDVMQLMDGVKADLFITDPPYNVDYVGKTKDALTIQNDKMNDDTFRMFLKDSFACANAVLKPGGVFYIWHADSEGFNFRGACFEVGWKVRECLIWVKNTLVMGRQDYQWKHEPCLYGWKEGASHLWASDRKQTTIIDFDRPSRSTLHPTMKPIGLFDYQIKNNTKGEDVCLDTFMGSGTTIMACEQNGRIAYGCELDEKYTQVGVERYIEFMKNNKEVFVLREGEKISYIDIIENK